MPRPERRRLLAGSIGPERIPLRPDRADADWFKPLHVRDATSARDRIATQIAAGADVVVAPTWLTHRRALLPLGETRRAAEWTAAAVRAARDGLEVGLERREAALAEAADLADATGGLADATVLADAAENEGAVGDAAREDRPTPLVAATLPALDDGAEQEHGRLLPREAATQRDYRDQAGILADASPDLLLVEGGREASGTRVAMAEAVDTGLPVWIALDPRSLTRVALDEWVDGARGVGVERLLVPPPLEARTAVFESDLAWGVVGMTATGLATWLDAGATVVARLDGATAPPLQSLREAIDRYEEVASVAARAAERRWADMVASAAAMAPGGQAVWIGEPEKAPLPAGFDWLVVDATEAPRLPQAHYRLIVATTPVPGIDRLLERGGVLVRAFDRELVRGATLGVVAVDEAAEPWLAIYRREG